MGKFSGKNIFITGGAGFIGSNMVEALLDNAGTVTVYDNLSSGNYEFIKMYEGKNGFRFIKGDLLDADKLLEALKGSESEVVIHLAANPNVRLGAEQTDLDLKQGTIATHNLLEAMRKSGARQILFSSSSVVYGEADVKPTPEHYGPLKPISLYGSAKLASEALITAYSHLFGIEYMIFRFANVIGKNSTHGVIYDFIKKLRGNSAELEVLGTGRQKKSYIDVSDCVGAMLFAFEKSSSSDIFNIASDDQISVEEIAKLVVARVAPTARIRFTNSERGWPGDVTDAFLSNEKLKRLGFVPKYSSRAAVEKAIDTILAAQA